MTNNEIMVNDIQIKNDENTFSVEIKDEAETLLAAHNSNPEAHKNIIGNLVEKTQALSSMMNEIEDNIVLSSEIPTKLSDLENDMNFVSETTIISALEKRNMVTLSQLDEKLEESKDELQNLININSNTITNKIETLKVELAEDIAPETISSLIQPSDNYLFFTITKSQQNFTMPADGILYFLGKSSSGFGWVRLARAQHKGYFVQNSVSLSGNYISVDIMVNKGEVVEASYDGGMAVALIFIYNNAWAQKIAESEEE